MQSMKTKKEFYEPAFGEERAKAINYYHRDLFGSYSIKKTLPVLVPALTYKGMVVGNGVGHLGDGGDSEGGKGEDLVFCSFG